MNIVVFTSAMVDKEFAVYQADANIKPNPSNQNFYSKLIRSLAVTNHVSVVSHRPIAKGMFPKNKLERSFSRSDNVKFYYTFVGASLKYKLLNETRAIYKAGKDAIDDLHSDEFVIIVDPLRLALLKTALALGKKYNVKVVGMLTDNPLNLTNNKTFISNKILKLAGNLDGYLSLSRGLVNAYNKNKPNYVFPGLVADETTFDKEPIDNYYFFAGSLYERYGVKTLVDAFHESNLQSRLVIAGSGPLAKYIENISHGDPRILYLTQLPKERVTGYENNALANINPRPLDTKLDNESVPSKMLEYLSVSTPIISTKFPVFYGPFKDDIYWIKGNEKEDIMNAIHEFEESDNLTRKRKASSAKLKAFEFYSLRVQCESITHFLTALNSSSNK